MFLYRKNEQCQYPDHHNNQIYHQDLCGKNWFVCLILDIIMSDRIVYFLKYNFAVKMLEKLKCTRTFMLGKIKCTAVRVHLWTPVGTVGDHS